MATFPCLEELDVVANFRSLFDGIIVYFKMETTIDLEFAVDLHNLWMQFINRTNDRKLFISELQGVPPSLMSYNCCQFLHQVQENDFIKLLEMRKMIAETYREVYKKLDFVSVINNVISLSEIYLEVAFGKSTCFVRDLQRGTEFKQGHSCHYFKEEGICASNIFSSNTLNERGVVKRRNRTLVEAARTMLSASKLPLFFWVEAIATAFYTQNISIIIPTHEKTTYHIINDRKPSIRHLHIFGCTCYLTRDSENLDKMKEKGDLCILASDYDNFGPAPQLQNVSPSADTTAPSQQELDLVFGPLYDEFFNACTSSVNKSSSPTDNSKQQDTPPTTNIQSSTEPTTPTINVNAEENNDNQAEDTQFQQNEFINPFCTPVREITESSSGNIDNSNMHTFYQPHDSEYRWTKDHPLEQVRGNPSKPVQTK
ncbi:retrovirus-related pol polyprotein from transposon TNT 1-94 [Tanacetum coccineum]